MQSYFVLVRQARQGRTAGGRGSQAGEVGEEGQERDAGHGGEPSGPGPHLVGSQTVQLCDYLAKSGL